jgi:transposase-like protein
MRYSKQFKLNLIKSFNEGIYSKSKIAWENNIPRQTLTRWIKLYKLFGEEGLENKKQGAKSIPIDEDLEEGVLLLWRKRKRSIYMMRRDLQKESSLDGKNISERQIKKIYDKWKLKK